MKRRLTVRECVLLALLGVILAVCGYVTLFYLPQTAERDRCLTEAEAVREQTETARVRLEEKRRMERELEEWLSAETPPLAAADYDNLKAVMTELDSILALTKEYKLSFSTSDGSRSIIRRSISMTFTAGSYQDAKTVLQRVHDSGFRCMLENVNLSLAEGTEGPVTVSGTIVFFEYQASPPETGG